MQDYKHDMGLRIKQERKRHGLTQEAMAEALDISVKHFSEVERGLAGLSVENLIKLSNLLGVSIDYILKGKADEEKWGCTLSALRQTPTGKEDLIKTLIDVGIQLAKNPTQE